MLILLSSLASAQSVLDVDVGASHLKTWNNLPADNGEGSLSYVGPSVGVGLRFYGGDSRLDLDIDAYMDMATGFMGIARGSPRGDIQLSIGAFPPDMRWYLLRPAGPLQLEFGPKLSSVNWSAGSDSTDAGFYFTLGAAAGLAWQGGERWELGVRGSFDPLAWQAFGPDETETLWKAAPNPMYWDAQADVRFKATDGFGLFLSYDRFQAVSRTYRLQDVGRRDVTFGFIFGV